jgi:hypothetical protein
MSLLGLEGEGPAGVQYLLVEYLEGAEPVAQGIVLVFPVEGHPGFLVFDWRCGAVLPIFAG